MNKEIEELREQLFTNMNRISYSDYLNIRLKIVELEQKSEEIKYLKGLKSSIDELKELVDDRLR